MNIKLKKMHANGIVKVEGKGEIKEVLIHTDLFNFEKGKVSICFRGHKTSGIIELSEKEASDLYKTIISKTGLIKVIK